MKKGQSYFLRFNQQDGLYHGWSRGREFTVTPDQVRAEYRSTFKSVMNGQLQGLNQSNPIKADEFAARTCRLGYSYISRIGQDGIKWAQTAPWLSTMGEWAIA